MRRLHTLITLVLLLCASTAPLLAQNAETTHSPLPVSGARYLGFKHKISYGDFCTSYVWATTVENASWSIIGPMRYKYLSKFKFKQTLGDLTVKAKMKQNLNAQEYATIAKVFGNRNIDKGYDYWGTVTDPGGSTWTMLCNTSFSDADFYCGEIYNPDTHESLSIYGRNRSSSKDLFVFHPLFAYSFIYHDKVIATIDSEDDGWVWIDATLQPEMQVVVAACISSLLMLKWQLR